MGNFWTETKAGKKGIVAANKGAKVEYCCLSTSPGSECGGEKCIGASETSKYIETPEDPAEKPRKDP